jgi:uncharacterized protein (DUF1919 family)
MQAIKAGINFPVCVLGDSGIEIHFLHYKTEQEAKDKWERRIRRMDWENLFVKYDCGKDYANKESVEKFLNLPYPNKLIFGNEDFGRKEIHVLKKYSFDAVIQFRNCFLSFNPINWLEGEDFKKKTGNGIIRKLAFQYL